MHGTYQANMAMHNADLIIAMGARFDDRITNAPSKFAPQAKIIHFDVDHSSVSKIIRSRYCCIWSGKRFILAINNKDLKTKIDEMIKINLDHGIIK